MQCLHWSPTEFLQRTGKQSFMPYMAHDTRANWWLVPSRVVWLKMNSDVAAWVRDCQQCCRWKVTTQPASPVQPNKEVQPYICVDLLGPFPASKSRSTYILTLVNRTSRLLEAILLRSVEASACADAFINMWVAIYFSISFSIQYWCVNLGHRLPRVMFWGTCVG